MTAIFSFIIKLLPFAAPLAEKLLPGTSKASELRAEADLVEAKAFARGRISPKYLLKFICVIAFGFFCVSFALHIFFPSTFHASPLDDLMGLLRAAKDVLME